MIHGMVERKVTGPRFQLLTAWRCLYRGKNGIGHRSIIADGHQGTLGSVLENLPWPAGAVGAHNWTPAGHGLDQDPWEPFVAR